MRKKVFLENLLAGAILKFDQVDDLDLTLLMGDMALNENIEVIDQQLNWIEQFITRENGIIRLRDGLSWDSQISPVFGFEYSVWDRFRRSQNETLNNYFDNLDLRYMVMKKIAMLPNVPFEKLDELFNQIEEEMVIELINNANLALIWNEENPHQKVVITPYGRVAMFMKENPKEVAEFKNLLASNGCDFTMLIDYLVSQNLDRERPQEILTLEGFNLFCQLSNRYPLLKVRENKPKTDN